MKNRNRLLMYILLSFLVGVVLFFLAAVVANSLPQVIPGAMGGVLALIVPAAAGGILGCIAGFTLWKSRQKLLERDKPAEERPCREIIDPDTGAANRESFDEYIHREWRRSLRSRKPISMIMCRILHQEGVEKDSKKDLITLQQVTAIFRQHVKRSADFIARYSDNELSVLLPETSLEGAARVAEMLRSSLNEWAVSQTEFDANTFPNISLGAASCIPSMSKTSDHLIEVAQQALDQAEKEGLIIVILPANE